ncbi:DUF3967 domain-containing protein (plasmid) [Bacillus carboniphilus]|uniref:DUF3967 domain-containing protein n=1 Tax=Bacillus carboniphilus TaxID=86663 RepID=A0ABY9JYM2_9BACI|nr:DUF3967 domain-containing protein [Bacillus carboniphilus]WLR44499.1 DUF3967 domain-containing protein [Bacillus carboniphilus]
MTEERNIYVSSDVSALLKIKESTLRKYCIMLEKVGYEFHKNELGHRGFFNNDVVTLRKLISLKNHPDMTLERACDAVMVWIKEEKVTEHDISETVVQDQHDERYNKLLEEFQQFKDQQFEFNKQLISKLEKQNEYINNRLEERDRKLMQEIRENLETRKMIAAAEEPKKGFWGKLFGR